MKVYAVGIMEGSEVDKFSIATAVGLEGLDSFSGRMSAKQQREIFGVAIFGKKAFTIDNTNQGRVFGQFSSGFESTSHFEFSFEQLSDRINAGFDYIS